MAPKRAFEIEKLEPGPMFRINQSEFPPTCLPVDLDTSGFIDITSTGDSWRRYLDPKTGRIHDGREYYRQCFGLEEGEP